MGLKERLHNAIHNEEFHHKPTFEELKEGGVVGGNFERPVDLNPYEANQVYHWEQRRRSRRVTHHGKR